MQVNPGAGKAELHVRDLALLDYPKIPVAIGAQWQTAFVPATISIDAVWDGPVTRRVNVQNGTNGDQFAGEFAQDQVTVSWSASNASGFRFTGDPGTLATTTIPGFAFAEVGHLTSGIFFPSGSDTAGAGPLLAPAPGAAQPLPGPAGQEGAPAPAPPGGLAGAALDGAKGYNGQPNQPALGPATQAPPTGALDHFFADFGGNQLRLAIGEDLAAARAG